MPLLERQGDNDIAVIEAIISSSSSSSSVLSFCVIPKDEDEVFLPSPYPVSPAQLVWIGPFRVDRFF